MQNGVETDERAEGGVGGAEEPKGLICAPGRSLCFGLESLAGKWNKTSTPKSLFVHKMQRKTRPGSNGNPGWGFTQPLLDKYEYFRKHSDPSYSRLHCRFP